MGSTSLGDHAAGLMAHWAPLVPTIIFIQIFDLNKNNNKVPFRGFRGKLEDYRPICTSNTEISDGDTPLIRLAWPSVRGLNLASFSLDSMLSELIFE
jgi:hypothetical protein